MRKYCITHLERAGKVDYRPLIIAAQEQNGICSRTSHLLSSSMGRNQAMFSSRAADIFASLHLVH